MSGDDLLVDGSKPPERRKPRHLIDWDNPPPPRRAEPMTLTQVQRWVISTLTMVTIAHFAGGIVLAALTASPAHQGGRLPLLLLAGVTGVCAVVAALAIHRKPLLSPWLLLGWLPTLVGAYFAYWH
ncbi:MAG TPA: hypothetical protein VFT75_05185 [Nocardioidaceae bacterium]|nr:hypothetical protein [Nocardioidaceae bacterium]